MIIEGQTSRAPRFLQKIISRSLYCFMLWERQFLMNFQLKGFLELRIRCLIASKWIVLLKGGLYKVIREIDQCFRCRLNREHLVELLPSLVPAQLGIVPNEPVGLVCLVRIEMCSILILRRLLELPFGCHFGRDFLCSQRQSILS